MLQVLCGCQIISNLVVVEVAVCFVKVYLVSGREKVKIKISNNDFQYRHIPLWPGYSRNTMFLSRISRHLSSCRNKLIAETKFESFVVDSSFSPSSILVFETEISKLGFFKTQILLFVNYKNCTQMKNDITYTFNPL